MSLAPTEYVFEDHISTVWEHLIGGPHTRLVELDLLTREWVGDADFVMCQHDTVTLRKTKFRRHHNEALVKRWMRKTGINLTRAQLSPDDIFIFSRVNNWLVVAADAWDERYGFFLQLNISFERFKEALANSDHLRETIDKYHTLSEATKTPICYLDEIVSHFILPAPAGLKYLALLRLFRVTVEDDNTKSESKKQRS